jgi:hypothetical protein
VASEPKFTSHHRVRSDLAGGKPIWEQLSGPPESREGLVGDVKVENDDQILIVYFEDEAAQERVTRSFRDAAALVQEHMIPHKPRPRPS